MLVTTYQTKLCYNAEIYDLNNNFSRNLEFWDRKLPKMRIIIINSLWVDIKITQHA
jgi:hypothetical protein